MLLKEVRNLACLSLTNMSFSTYLSQEYLKLLLRVLSCLCTLVSISACTIFCSYFRTVPFTKKNILTRLDELLVLNMTFFCCFQCSVCLLSLLCQAQNDYVYLAFYVILYGNLVSIKGIGIGLSFSRVFIIFWVFNLKLDY